MSARKHVALACAALVASAAAVVAAGPAQAGHNPTMAGGFASAATAELKIAAQPITSLRVCLRDENGNPYDCQTHPVGAPADSVRLTLEYALVKSENHLPRIDSLAGLLPAASCPESVSTLQNKPGVSLLATGATFQSGSTVKVEVFHTGAPVTDQPIQTPPSNRQSAPGVGAVVCLL